MKFKNATKLIMLLTTLFFIYSGSTLVYAGVTDNNGNTVSVIDANTIQVNNHGTIQTITKNENGTYTVDGQDFSPNSNIAQQANQFFSMEAGSGVPNEAKVATATNLSNALSQNYVSPNQINTTDFSFDGGSVISINGKDYDFSSNTNNTSTLIKNAEKSGTSQFTCESTITEHYNTVYEKYDNLNNYTIYTEEDKDTGYYKARYWTRENGHWYDSNVYSSTPSVTMTGKDGREYNVTLMFNGDDVRYLITSAESTTQITNFEPVANFELTPYTNLDNFEPDILNDAFETVKNNYITGVFDLDHSDDRLSNDARIAGIVQQDGYIQGLSDECHDYYVNGSINGSSSDNCKAYQMIMEDSAINQTYGIGVYEQLEKLQNTLLSSNYKLTEKDIEKLEQLLEAAQNNGVDISGLDWASIQAKIDMYNKDLFTACEDEGNEVINGECVPACDDGYERVDGSDECTPILSEEELQEQLNQPEPVAAASAVTSNGANPDTTGGQNLNNVQPVPTITGTPEPLPTGVIDTPCAENETLVNDNCVPIKECAENETLVNETCVPIEDEEDKKVVYDAIKTALENINKDVFGDEYEPKTFEVDGLVGKLYIKSEIDLMTEDDDLYLLLEEQEDGSLSYKTENGQNGEAIAYSKAYNIDGEVISDVVIASQQIAILEVSDANGLVKNSEVKLFGQGNRKTYNAYGYASITIGEIEYKFVIESDYNEDGTLDREKTTINISPIGANTAVPNSVRGLIKQTIVTMEEYNYKSYEVSTTVIDIDTLKEDETTGIEITLVNNDDDRTVVVAENGIKTTYKYSMNQLVTLPDKTTIYSLEDVMKHNLIDIRVLIASGFKVTRNDELVTKDTINGLTYATLLDRSTATSTDKKHEDKFGVTIDENKQLVSLGDWLTDDKLEQIKEYDPEYVWSDDKYDYYLPAGIINEVELQFYDKETDKYVTTSFREALQKGYITASDLATEFRNQGVNVVSVEIKESKPSFLVIANINDEKYTKEITPFYTSGAYSYSFEYKELVDNVIIQASNGIKYTLRYVLDHNIYTIDEIVKQIEDQNAKSDSDKQIVVFVSAANIQQSAITNTKEETTSNDETKEVETTTNSGDDTTETTTNNSSDATEPTSNDGDVTTNDVSDTSTQTSNNEVADTEDTNNETTSDSDIGLLSD